MAVGQVEERKGYVFMLTAWEHITLKYPNSVLLIAGPKNDSSNAYYQKLISIIKESNLKNVQFLGLINNVND